MLKGYGNLTVLVGIPGSGKSTWARDFGGRAIIVSTDQIREEFWGDASDQRNPKKVFEYAYAVTKCALADGHNVIFDATNLTKKTRARLLEETKRFTNEKYAIVFMTPFDTCMRRNAARARVVPENVLEAMLRKLETPTEDEGFDKIITI